MKRLRITPSPLGELVQPEVTVRSVRETFGRVVVLNQVATSTRLADDYFVWEGSELTGLADDALIEHISAHGVLGPVGPTEDLPSGYTEIAQRELKCTDELTQFMLDRNVSPANAAYAFENLVHLDKVRMRSELLRAMTRFWQATASGATTVDQCAVWTDLIGRKLRISEARELFIATLNAGLSGLPETTRPQIRLGPMSGPEPVKSSYAVACSQLFNQIVRDAPFHVCAAQDCRRLFVHQRGAAREGQYRTKGVDYCSRTCSVRVNVRKHRERQRISD